MHTTNASVQNNMTTTITQSSFINLIEKSIRIHWDLNALTDYKGITLQYKDIARKIEKMHIVLHSAGINKGDKIAICGRNSAHWCVSFLGIITYGAVAVPILHEFKPDNIHHIVNHSESRLLFVGDQIWENLNEGLMPNLEGIVGLKSFELLFHRSKQLAYAHNHLNEEFGKKYPCRFRAEDVSYNCETGTSLAILNYTSGTTGFSKGVMLSYNSITSNLFDIKSKSPLKPGAHIVSILPMGHIFGLVFDFLNGITAGAHIWFLTRMPSPKIVTESFAEIRPDVIACVPLVVEKIFKSIILPKVDNRLGKLLLRVPILNDKIKKQILHYAMEVFGGNFSQIVIGGAPFNAEVEAFLRSIHFPYTIAYGMTECGPLICYSPWEELKYTSCGKTVSNMETQIASDNPETKPGELVCRGQNLMLGYYKNEEATAQTIDSEGWLHTGDMAIKDNEGNIYIKGRCKNMLLTAAGQNIYPEEIEARLNNMPYVNESLLILKNSKLTALIYPEFNIAMQEGLTHEQLHQALDRNRKELNATLPPYSQIARIKIYNEEFEKTAKKSIKRYMYQ